MKNKTLDEKLEANNSRFPKIASLIIAGFGFIVTGIGMHYAAKGKNHSLGIVSFGELFTILGVGAYCAALGRERGIKEYEEKYNKNTYQTKPEDYK